MSNHNEEKLKEAIAEFAPTVQLRCLYHRHSPNWFEVQQLWKDSAGQERWVAIPYIPADAAGTGFSGNLLEPCK